jgi:hypothetical protein
VAVLVALAIVDALVRFKPGTYFASACVVTVLVYAGFGLTQWYALYSLQQQYPYESMEARLPVHKKADARAVGHIDEVTLSDLEGRLDETQLRHWQPENVRLRDLYLVHEGTVEAFAQSFGFGAGRMRQLNPPSEESLAADPVASAPIPQPVPRDWDTMSAEEFERPASVRHTAGSALRVMHQDSLLAFLKAQDYGYFKDRRHVAGFRPHQFRQAPDTHGEWSVATLELVGLVMHDTPVAYVSKTLPRMDLLREAPTRRLDSFETQGLAQLQAGETLVMGEQGARLRLLGAIRATKQCVECHGCERGDLLGAFSYVLRR